MKTFFIVYVLVFGQTVSGNWELDKKGDRTRSGFTDVSSDGMSLASRVADTGSNSGGSDSNLLGTSAIIIIGSKIKKNAKNNSYYRISVVVDNDPANEVDSVNIKFLMEGSSNPPPIPNNISLVKSKENGTFKTFSYKKLDFQGGAPIGLSYSIQSTMLNSEGKEIGLSVTEAIVVEKSSDFGILSSSLKENAPASGIFTMKAFVNGDLKKIAVCKVSIKPAEKGASLASPDVYPCSLTKADNSNSILENTKITFNKPDKSAKILGMTYFVTFYLIDEKNNVVDELDDEIVAEE